MKKIKFNNLGDGMKWWIIIITAISIFTLIIAFITPTYNEIDERLKDVSHVVCVNETILEEKYLICSGSYPDVSCCKRGTYDSLGNEAIQSLNGKTCIIEIKREVCKWVDAEGNELK